jgi:hypothetical protein
VTEHAVLYAIPGSHPAQTVRFADGSRAQGTRPLARALDRVQPEPRLVPDDTRVEEAERWGDDVLQQWARRMVVEAGVRDPDLLNEHGGAGRLGPLLMKHDSSRRQMGRLVKVAYRMTAEQLRNDQGRVDEMLDREYRLDVRDDLWRRPGAQLMERVLPGGPA